MIFILKCSIILLTILNITNFINIIKTKNKKNVIQDIILSVITFVISYYYLENLINLDVGLECLIQELFVVISFGSMILSIIIGLFRYKKCTENTWNSIKHLLLILIVLLLSIVIVKFETLREKDKIYNGEIIFIFNYQNGIIQSDYYTYIANENSVSSIDIDHTNINKYTNFKLERKEHTYYYINYINNSNEFQIEKNYVDENLTGFDKELINTIMEDIKKNHNNEIKHVSICKLEECDYYVIDLYTNNKLLYKKDKYVGTIKNAYGTINDVYLIKK